MKHFFLVVCCAVLLLPALYIGGCGGGSSPLNPLPVTLLSDFPLQLADGRVAHLSASATGAQTTATLVVPAGVALKGHSRAGKAAELGAATVAAQALALIPFNIDAGTYVFNGSFSPPRTVNLGGSVMVNGQSVPFAFAGTVPTLTQSGSVVVTVNGVAQTVNLPAISNANGTPTPTPTQPQPGDDKFTGTISASTANISGAPIDAPNISSIVAQATNTQIFLQQVGVQSGIGNRSVTLAGGFPPPIGSSTPGSYEVGRSYTFGQTANGATVTLVVGQNTTSTTSRLFRANAGTLKITGFSNGKFTAQVINAVLNADNVAGTDKTATGHFTLSGNATFAGTAPQPTPTPTQPGTINNQAQLTFTNAVNSNIGRSGDTLASFANAARSVNTGFGATFVSTDFTRTLNVDVINAFNPLKQGVVVNFAIASQNLFLYQDQSAGSGVANNHAFSAQSGTLKVTKFTTINDPITFEMTNIVMVANNAGGTTGTGSFTLNGTANFTATNH